MGNQRRRSEGAGKKSRPSSDVLELAQGRRFQKKAGAIDAESAKKRDRSADPNEEGEKSSKMGEKRHASRGNVLSEVTKVKISLEI